jgi:hypothetical protein
MRRGVLLLLVTSSLARAEGLKALGDLLEAWVDASGVEGRGFVGVGRLGDAPLAGGDVRYVLRFGAVEAFVGGRFGQTSGTAAVTIGQAPRGVGFSDFEFGVKVYPWPDLRPAPFAAVGASLGNEFVDHFSFSYASRRQGFLEVGVDAPRTFPVRLIAALRFEVGGAQTTAGSRIPAEGTLWALTANVGFALGFPVAGPPGR